MTALLPRLAKSGVATILATHSPSAPTPLDEQAALGTHPQLMSFGPSGGAKSVSASFDVGRGLRDIAIGCGFPGQLSKAKFDREAAVYLAQHSILQSGEALRNDVWAFLATIVAPDLVAWRFQDAKKERFEGGVRNTFQRLWLRGKALDRGDGHPERWSLVLSMPEDAAVQIVERPSLGGRYKVALALGEGWLEMTQTAPLGDQEKLMRTGTKLLRIQNEIVDLSYLPEDELADAVRIAFRKARAAWGLGVSPRSPAKDLTLSIDKPESSAILGSP